MTSGTSTSYFHYDGLGSVVNMTSSSGSRRWTWSYEPFGVIRTEEESGNGPANFMQFTGEYVDPTGLYHLRARQYDPATGRFPQRDPVDARVGSTFIAAYVYAANRPTVMVDPSGKTFEPAADWHERLRIAVSPASALEPWPPFVPGRPPRTAHELVHPIARGFAHSETGIHPTSGLPGYPAIDFLARGGTPVLAVQSGTVRRHSGRNPASGVVSGSVFGWSLYLRADSGSDFFYTHLGDRRTRENQRVRAGQVIGSIGHWPRDPARSHVHVGVSGGPISIERLGRARKVRPR
jgi:RHS repeat-associated protein